MREVLASHTLADVAARVDGAGLARLRRGRGQVAQRRSARPGAGKIIAELARRRTAEG